MANRKGWEQLSDSYRNRLQNKGITKSSYSSGKSIETARGHSTTPEHSRVTLTVQGRTTVTRSYAAMAARAGVTDIIPTFDTLTRTEQNRLGKLYVKSFFEKGTGELLNKAERKDRNLHPKDRRVYRHAGDEQINGRIEFQEQVSLLRSAWKDKEDYAEFRICKLFALRILD